MVKIPSFYTPWTVLDEYRGKIFNDRWPTLPQMFALSANRFPNNIAFSAYEESQNNKVLRAYNYAQGKELVDNIAGFLIEQGVKKGDKLVVSGVNSLEWAITFLAIMQAGAIAVPIDNGMGSEKALALSQRVGAKMLFCDHEKLAKGFDKANLPTYSLTKDTANYVLNLSGTTKDFPPAGQEDVAAILFTSGTTGNEKGVVLTHRALISDSYLVQGLIHVYSNDVFYVLLPIHHIYCMTAVFITALTGGAQLLFTDKLAITNILHDLKEGKVTCLLGVPMLYNKVINGLIKNVRKRGPVVMALVSGLMAVSGSIRARTGRPVGKKMPILKGILAKASLSSLRVLISGGGPIAGATLTRYRQLGLDMIQGYGLTETGPIITLNPPHAFKEGSVGRVLPETDIIILQPNEQGIGEIAVKGPMVFNGYYNDDETTAAAFTADGYFKTGDLGWKDSDNYVYLTGRAKNIIVTEGGKNVYPEEVEDAFQLVSQFEQLLVRGYMINERLKIEDIEAVIYPSSDFIKDKTHKEVNKQLIALILEGNKKLQPYQQVRRIRVVNTPLELSSTNKIKRFSAAKDAGTIIFG
ncbi:MAG: AMP-binding protein [Spirochaetaceae bacterium]|nr:AMP-binding protein [Spirochaetaceae bacterium]